MAESFICRKIQLISRGMDKKTTFMADHLEVTFDFNLRSGQIEITDAGITDFIINLDDAGLPLSIDDQRHNVLQPQMEYLEEVFSNVIRQLYSDVVPPMQLLQKCAEIAPSEFVPEGMFTVGLARVGKRIADSEVKDMVFGEKMISFDFADAQKKIEIYDQNVLILRVYLSPYSTPKVVDYREDKSITAKTILDTLMMSVVCRVESARLDMDSNIFPHPNGENNEALLAAPEAN